uniref:Uncharacterized protein n=1 Tax=Arundo donax TaxID=35708 RepID=A0A0A9CBH4_ARUDO
MKILLVAENYHPMNVTLHSLILPPWSSVLGGDCRSILLSAAMLSQTNSSFLPAWFLIWRDQTAIFIWCTLFLQGPKCYCAIYHYRVQKCLNKVVTQLVDPITQRLRAFIHFIYKMRKCHKRSQCKCHAEVPEWTGKPDSTDADRLAYMGRPILPLEKEDLALALDAGRPGTSSPH